MKTRLTGTFLFLLMFLAGTATLPSAVHADELSELYLNSTNNNSNSGIGANILILLDTSGSMTNHGDDKLGFTLDPEAYWHGSFAGPYNPDLTYPGPCDPDTAYRKSFSRDRDNDGDYDIDDVTDDDFQECDNDNNFPLSVMACEAVLLNGFAIDKFAEFRPNTPGPNNDYTINLYPDDEDNDPSPLDGDWESLNRNFNGIASIDGITVWRECAGDAGNHGGGSFAGYYRYPRDSESNYPWTNNQSFAEDLGDESRQLVANGNYINYFRWAQTRLAAVQAALREVIAELPPETRIGIMRFDVKAGSSDATDGGYMIQEFVELGPNTVDASGNVVLSAERQAIIESVYAIDPADDGATPLGESLFEALQVYRGDRVHFGLDAETWNIDTTVWPWDNNTTDHVEVSSVAESLVPGSSPPRYQSPVIFECQKNAVIFLSDGAPDSDNSASQRFDDLPNAPAYGAVGCDDGDNVSCLREIADYMANEDLLPEMDGNQTVTTYTVGFGTDISDTGVALLAEAAERGGGTYTAANDYETLKNAFQVIFREEIARNQTLSSPAVTVNAFNRLAHEDSLFFTMFDPIFDSVHWPGNVKKYRLAIQDDGTYRIVDQEGVPALNDDSSEIRYDAFSFWTDENDPAIVANGGADGDKTELGGAAAASGYFETLYSWYGDTARKNLTHPANAFDPDNLTNELLGLDADASEDDRTHVFGDTIGIDAHDRDGDGNSIEPTMRIGAAPHGIPAIVNYVDGSEASQVIYAPTNDGILHAFNAADGADLWGFIPTELMPNLSDLHHPPEDTYIGYGLDGSVIAHTEEIDGNEHKWLFFGMRRGGRSMYALDVTDKDEPKILWRIQGGDTPGFGSLGQTWSEPRVARISVGGTPTTVLVFGGGYDADIQDSADAANGYVDDIIGNALYIVRADDGELLWSAGPSGPDLTVPQMQSSIAAPVEIMDRNGDGIDDLIYAVDLGGRIFRFDIGQSGGGLSVTGGMIASLGAGEGGSLADNRKFFNEPDVVLAAKDGQGYWAINVGSGDRERPKSNMTTQNYLFSIKDPYVFERPPSYDYGITLDDLYDATANEIQSTNADVAAAARAALLQADGWRVALAHDGEKALARATTFDFRVFFTTFDPEPMNTNACNAQPGTARLYALDLMTAGAPGDANNDGSISAEDRETVLSHGTIPPPVTIMFIEKDDGTVEAVPLIGRSDDDVPVDEPGVVRRTFWNVLRDEDREQ